MTTNTAKLSVGDEFTQGKARWKVTVVYGYRESYGSVAYAAVRWVKSTQKWSSNAYLKTERNLEHAE